MQIRLPHRVVYEVGQIVPVEEVIGTLQANQLLAYEVGQMLERLLPGLAIERVNLEVRSIETGSLREYFFLALVVAFQEDLKKEVPALLEKWAGLPVADEYDSVVTVVVMVMLFYGADFIYRKFIAASGSKHLSIQIESLVAELSLATGRPETLNRPGFAGGSNS